MPTQTPQAAHLAFDALCEQVDEWEHLPSVKSTSPELAREVDVDVEGETAPLDGLILAGLVVP